MDPGDPGWVPLPGLPDGCVIERAERPETLFSAEWEPCPNLASCQQLVHDPGYDRAFESGVGYHDGERGYFALVRGFPRDHRRIVVLGATEGPPLGAWRAPDPATLPGYCGVGPVAMHDDAAAFVVGTYWTDVWPNESRVYHGGLDEIGTLMEPNVILGAPFIPGTSSPQTMAVSRTTTVLEIQLAGFVAIVEGSKARRLDNLPGELAGTPQALNLVGRSAFWQEWGNHVRVAHGAMDQEVSLFRAVEDGDVMGFSTDGVDMAWVQQYGVHPDGTYDTIELWTAPYTTDPAKLQPRMVRDLTEAGIIVKGTVGGGLFVHGQGIELGHVEMRLYDLGDGRLRRFEFPPAREVPQRPCYLTQEEMLIPVSPWGVSDDVPRTLYRIDVSSLPYEE